MCVCVCVCVCVYVCVYVCVCVYMHMCFLECSRKFCRGLYIFSVVGGRQTAYSVDIS